MDLIKLHSYIGEALHHYPPYLIALALRDKFSKLRDVLHSKNSSDKYTVADLKEIIETLEKILQGESKEATLASRICYLACLQYVEPKKNSQVITGMRVIYDDLLNCLNLYPPTDETTEIITIPEIYQDVISILGEIEVCFDLALNRIKKEITSKLKLRDALEGYYIWR